MTKIQQHLFHLVDSSPWPFFGSCGALFFTLNFSAYLHGFKLGGILTILGLLYLICVATGWWKDVIRESTYQGNHTVKVQNGLKMGIILFIVTEIMLFLAFFLGFLTF